MLEIYDGLVTGLIAGVSAHGFEPLITDSHFFDEVYGEIIWDGITSAACTAKLSAYATLYSGILSNPAVPKTSCLICESDLTAMANEADISADISAGSAEGRWTFSLINGGFNTTGPLGNPKIITGAVLFAIALGATPTAGTAKFQIVKVGHRREDALDAFALTTT